MAYQTSYPSYLTCVAEVLGSSPQPLTIDALMSEVALQRPVDTGTRHEVSRAVAKLYQAIEVAPDRYGWLSTLLKGNIFRHPLTNEEANNGFLMLDELEHAVFFPQFFQTHSSGNRVLTVELFGGPTVSATACLERKTWSLRLGEAFVEWVDLQGGAGRDDILIRVDDAETGHYTVRLQPREARDDNEIQSRNLQLAFLAEEIVAADNNTLGGVPAWELAARLIGKGFFNEPIPADDMHYVLHQFSLLYFDTSIGYTLNKVRQEEGVMQANKVNTPSLVEQTDPLIDTSVHWEHPNSPPAFDDDHGDFGRNFSSADTFGAEDYDAPCSTYDEYVKNYYDSNRQDALLDHEEYHLLEAELASLLGLELEFGHLLREQDARKEELAARLFIDTMALEEEDNDMDFPDDLFPLWGN